jgi:phosphoribosylamine--glycine ligase
MIEIVEALISEKLHKINLKFEDVSTVVKCIAPKGYPNRRDLAKDHPVTVDEEAVKKLGCQLFYGSVDLKHDGSLITGGSRISEVLARASTIPEASEKAEKCMPYIRCVDGWGVFHRSDIGSEVLLRRRIEQANLIRGVYKYRMKKGLIGVSIDWIPGRGKITYTT